jgi:hypothetical protein
MATTDAHLREMEIKVSTQGSGRQTCRERAQKGETVGSAKAQSWSDNANIKGPDAKGK